MNNHEVAEVLETIANLLEISQASPFRVRAFRRASEALEGLDEELSTLAEEQRLTDIDGIGKSIAQDIRELLATGSCEALEGLKNEVPEGLLELLNIRGMGPKKVSLLWRELDIVDLDTLREALDAGRVAKLKGFGKKTVANTYKELDRIKRFKDRTPLGLALHQD